ncbi:MAG: nucleotidyltransferase domain-containing protein [Ignavibacteriaceae bacterium]|jgi:predicted nucleotidyltransferase
MVINKILDEVFSTWSNIAVLRVLNKVKIGLSGREIAKQAGMSAPSCLEALSSLENFNIVTRQRGGRDHFFNLNREHFLSGKVIVPILNQEKKYQETLLKEIVKTLENYSSSLFLFGSVARKEEKIDSDLDVCIVYKNVNSKKKIESVISELGFLLHKRYGVSLAPFYVSESDFVKKIKTQKPPIVDVLKEGKLLFGKSIKELLNDKTNN